MHNTYLYPPPPPHAVTHTQCVLGDQNTYKNHHINSHIRYIIKNSEGTPHRLFYSAPLICRTLYRILQYSVSNTVSKVLSIPNSAFHIF